MANGGIIGPVNTVNAAQSQNEVIHYKTATGTITTAALTTEVKVALVAGGAGGSNE